MQLFLKWWDAVETFALHKLLPGIITAVIGILAVRILLRLLDQVLSRKANMAGTLVKAVVRVVLYVLLGLTVLSNIGVDVSGVVALASVLTLAVSLSLQNILANLFGGMSLLYTKPFVPGHYVTIGGKSGTVREVGLIYTKLVTPDNKIISLPNSAVSTAEIINFTETGRRRVEITVSASYDAPVDRVLAALTEAAKVENALEDPAPTAYIEKYGDSAIEYTLLLWAPAGVFLDVQHAVTANIKKVFDAHNIEMTYPHLNIHVEEKK